MAMPVTHIDPPSITADIPDYQKGMSGQTINVDTHKDTTKAKSSRVRTRTTATLSSAQLSRKRVHDRNSQRASRQRTKSYIKYLETRIEEFSVTEHQSELAELRRRNQELETTIAELHGEIALRVKPLDFGFPVVSEIEESDPISNQEMVISTGKPSFYPQVTPISRSNTSDIHSASSCIVDIVGSYETETDNSELAMGGLPLPYVLNTSYSMPSSFVNQPTTKFWEIPVLLLPPENAVSGVLISVLHEKRMENMWNATKHQFPNKPSFRTLLFPNESDDPISVTLINMLLSTGMTRIPEIVAAVWGMCKIMQWQTRPCLETYNELPVWLSPRASQLSTPHPHWVTMIQFPRLRDRVIERQDLYATSRFLVVYPQSLRVNWPFEDIETIDFENGSFTINDEFEKHLLNIENWSVTAPFTHAYPELQSVVRFTS